MHGPEQGSCGRLVDPSRLDPHKTVKRAFAKQARTEAKKTKVIRGSDTWLREECFRYHTNSGVVKIHTMSCLSCFHRPPGNQRTNRVQLLCRAESTSYEEQADHSNHITNVCSVYRGEERSIGVQTAVQQE